MAYKKEMTAHNTPTAIGDGQSYQSINNDSITDADKIAIVLMKIPTIIGLR